MMRWSNVVTIALFLFAAVVCALAKHDQLAFGFAISAAALAVPHQAPPAGGGTSGISEISGAFRRIIPTLAMISGLWLHPYLEPALWAMVR